jgi:SAM-dependent methyltransferase
VGIEISEVAYKIAKEYDRKTQFILGTILEMPFNEDLYDAIFCYNTLHLFLRENRIKILENCYKQLRTNGFVFFTVFSDKEKSFGKGKEIEENTFESKPGRPTHYFSEHDLIEHFKEYSIVETGILKDRENHGEIGLHTHTLRYIFAQKNEKI